MIDAENRSLLTDVLTPPPGYEFDSALATTYTLDLITLLGLPLHLACLGGYGEDFDAQRDMLPAHEALRRISDRITVFCHRSGICMPRLATPLVSVLEPMVQQVESPNGGAFHPKVWLLRFAHTENRSAFLRLLVLTRNLTEDRSWDISLKLEAVPGTRSLKSLNKPLRQLFELCLQRTEEPLSPGRATRARDILKDVDRCEWVLPAGFSELHFHVLGASTRMKGWLPEPAKGQWDTIGVVSPFVTAKALKELTATARSSAFLVSRADQLAACGSSALEQYEQCLVMNESLLISDSEDDAPETLRGLHAKAFITTQGAHTHFFIGSANATSAALSGRNVEFMVELRGRRRHVGDPRSFIDREAGIGALLTQYVAEEAQPAADADRQRVEAMRERLCEAPLRLECTAHGERWTLQLVGTDCLTDILGNITAWSAVESVGKGASLRQGVTVLGHFSAHELTCLTVFRIAVNQEALCFTLKLPATGFPEDRAHRLLTELLRNREAFTVYMQLLLNLDPSGIGGRPGNRPRKKGKGGSGFYADTPLFEHMARCLVEDPQRLRHLQHVVTTLRDDEWAHEVLPEDFMELWEPFELALADTERQGNEL